MEEEEYSIERYINIERKEKYYMN